MSFPESFCQETIPLALLSKVKWGQLYLVNLDVFHLILLGVFTPN